MSAPSSAALLAQQLHKLRSAALQWLSSHYPSMSFSEAEDLVSEGVANYYERLSAGTIALDTDFMRYTFKAIQNMASKSVRHLGRVTSSDDIDQERSEAFSTETSEEIGVCIESAETLLDEVTKLTDDSGDALWKDQCIELVNRCIGELQDPAWPSYDASTTTIFRWQRLQKKWDWKMPIQQKQKRISAWNASSTT